MRWKGVAAAVLVLMGGVAVRAPLSDFVHQSAVILAANGRWEDALDLWNIAVRLNQGQAAGWVGRGEARLHVGPSPDAAASVDDLNHALALDPNSASALQARAQARIALGDVTGAAADATQALQIDPNMAGAYLTRGQAWIGAGDDVKAAADFGKALDLNPRMLMAWVTRAWIRSRLHDDEGALEDFDRALHLDPQNPQLWANRAALRTGQGDVTGALSDMAQAFRLGPTLARPYEVRAQLEACQGRYKEALADCQRALDMGDRGSYVTRAMVRSCQGDEAGALQDAAHSDEAATKAAVEYESGQWQGAIDDYQKAADAHQGSETYYRFYQFLARRRLGQSGEQLRPWVRDHAPANPWEKAIAGYLLGDVTESELLSQAHDAGQRCEGTFYVGSLRLLAGDKAGARQFFQQAADTHLAPYYEYRSALAELRRL